MSLRPFIWEMPSWAYAVALSQPKVVIRMPWNASSAATCELPPLKPPSNGMIEKFDGGFNGGSSQVAALEAFHGILMTTFGWDSATAYAHEGISQMNGRSDIGEYFRQADFQTTLDYATSHHLARYTNWSVNRDRQCAEG